MKMKAKMQVDSIPKNSWSETLKLSAVCGKTQEDNSYSQATPSGSLELCITNQELHGQFKPGQKFYLEFTEATE